MTNQLPNDPTGREPSLSFGTLPELTGLEPALGTQAILGSRPQIALALIQARIGSRQGLRALITTLRNGAYRQRIEAAEALASIQAREAEDAVASLITDPEPLVRRACATALGRIGRESILPALTTLLEDNNGDVRESAVRAITSVALRNEADPAITRRVVRELSTMLNDNSVVTQEVVTVMLGWIGGEDAAKALEQARTNGSARVRKVAEVASEWASSATADQPSVGSYRKRYRNPIAAGWVVARHLLPRIDVLSNVLIAALFVGIAAAAVWYSTITKDEITMIPQCISLPAIVFLPVLTYGLSWQFANQYRKLDRIQALKLAPIPKTVIHWGYVLTSLYRLRLPILGVWAMTFQDVLRADQSASDRILNWVFIVLTLLSTLYLAFIGTATAIGPKQYPLFPLLPIVTVVLIPSWWLCYGMILLTPDLSDPQKANWIVVLTISLIVVMGALLYRIRHEA